MATDEALDADAVAADLRDGFVTDAAAAGALHLRRE